MTKNFSKFSKGKKASLKDVGLALKLFNNSMKYASYRKFGFPGILPISVRISITNKCDSRCKSCHIWTYYNKNSGKLSEEMNSQELKAFVDNNNYLQDIGLTGGQVTLKEDIVDMWLYLDNKGYRTGCAMNSVDLKKIIKLENKLLENLSGNNIHMLLVSIDGFEDTHDYNRGIKGNFKNALKLLEWGLEKKKEYDFLEVLVPHTITRSNYKQFPDFIGFLVDKGLRPLDISFRPAIYLERFHNMGSKETLIEINREVVSVISEVQKKYKDYNNYFVNGIIKFLENPKKQVVPCYAGHTFFYIDPYWNVYGCMEMKTILGNLRENNFSLKNILNSYAIKKDQNRINAGNCMNCWNPCHAGPSMVSSPIGVAKLGYENFIRLFY